jgi:DNA-binding NarL/FixJ family response regulator
MSDKRPIETDKGHPDVTVLAADDQDAFLLALCDLVQLTPGFTLAAKARSGEEALALVAEQPPNIVLMDARMPGIGGIEATRRISQSHAATVVVLISVDVEALPRTARSCGASMVIKKLDLRPETLREVWRAHRPESVPYRNSRTHTLAP